VPSVEHTAAREILAGMAIFKDRPFKLSSIYNQHNEEKCFHVTVTGDLKSYKARFSSATSRKSVEREYEALRCLERHGVEWTPHIYEVLVEEPSCLVTSFEDGESLDKSLTWTHYSPTIIVGLQRILADIHEIQGSYYGHLGGARYGTWSAFLEVRLWRHVLPLAQASLLNEMDLRKIRDLFDEVGAGFDQIRPTLLHGDVKAANILFDEATKKTALIDFELARFGDIDFEWTKLERMAIRWPEYRNLVANPLLTSVSGPPTKEKRAKLLLYNLYHACSFLDFELETNLPVPSYRLRGLEELLRQLRAYNS
jgi:serine/threonine protein kinase